MQEFITNNADKIWTIISTLIGALISYIVTTSAENKREKRAAQREKLTKILIPYCKSLENAVYHINNCETDSYNEFYLAIFEPIEYLTPEKRVYLSKRAIEDLSHYRDLVNQLQETLLFEKKLAQTELEKLFAKKLNECDKISPEYKYAKVTINDSDEICMDILNNRARSHIDLIKTISLGSGNVAFLFEISEAIKKGAVLIRNTSSNVLSVIDEKEIYHPSNKEYLSQYLYTYLKKISLDNELEQIYGKTKSSDLLKTLKSFSEKMHNRLLKDIDYIAN